MYTIVDLLFAAIIFAVGITIAVILLMSGSVIGMKPISGVLDCTYSYIESGLIPTLIKEGKYTYIEQIVRQCGASGAKIIDVSHNNTIYSYPIQNCTYIETVIIYIPKGEMKGEVYEIILCIH